MDSVAVEGAEEQARIECRVSDAEAEARGRAAAYLRRLGWPEGSLAALAADCLVRARRGVRADDPEDLGRRAIAGAQRALDAHLQTLLDLDADAQTLAAARAAALLSGEEQLLRAQGPNGEALAALRGALPRACPAEAPLQMPVQRLEFASINPWRRPADGKVEDGE